MRLWVLAVLAGTGLLLLPTVAAAPTSTGGSGTPGYATFEASAGCATTASCTVHPAASLVAGQRYVTVAYVHGLGRYSDTVTDSLGGKFHLMGICWLDNGIFGQTQVWITNATLVSPARFAVTLTITNPPGQEYLEVALASDPGSADRVAAWSSTCANHWSRPGQTYLTVPFTVPQPHDLGIFLFVLGHANGTVGTITCGSAPNLTAVVSCGTSLSGTAYGNGLSWPAFAFQNFPQAGAEAATIEVGGGGFGEAPTPWDVAYVVLATT